MRSIGIALLIIGFGWLLLEQVSLALQGTRPALRTVYAELDAQPNKLYSRQEVEKLVKRSASAQADACPFFVLPGLAMLLGGLLGTVSSRRASARHGA
jgi:hypothetical protein